ncbi:MAG: bifunctional UDP-N-acetylglucosamine diphosphorylase/glucosamine-1-phosphate N-acetyltransferase GlmU, partial [Oscillospiraceae bacterium]
MRLTATLKVIFMDIMANEKRYMDIIDKHMKNGVRFYTSHGIVIDENVKIGKGSLIMPGTILQGETTIGENCVIGPNSLMKDCTVGDGVTFNSSQANEAVIKSGASIGPFSQLRPNTTIGESVKIGDFVEVKNSNIGQGTAIAHLTYIGDSDVGAHVNFGCGVVTVNYDGQSKNRTTIEDYAFIGCNTNLIAPVTVGQGGYTAAGSTITQDVPKDALAIARARQINKPNWAKEKLSGYIK